MYKLAQEISLPHGSNSRNCIKNNRNKDIIFSNIDTNSNIEGSKDLINVSRKKNIDNELGIDFDELKEKFNDSLNQNINKGQENQDCIEVLSDGSQKYIDFKDNDTTSNVSIDSIESDFNLLRDENKNSSSLNSKKKNKLITKD